MKKKKTLNPARHIIREFGGLRAAARAIGRAPSAVHRWKVNREIPITAIKEVLIAGKKSGIKFSERMIAARK